MLKQVSRKCCEARVVSQGTAGKVAAAVLKCLLQGARGTVKATAGSRYEVVAVRNGWAVKGAAGGRPAAMPMSHGNSGQWIVEGGIK